MFTQCVKYTLALCLGLGLQGAAGTAQAGACGELVSLQVHGGHRLNYAYQPANAPGPEAPVTLALLAGGSGFVDLDEQACPRALTGNSLVRSIPLFRAMGFNTALIDAPGNYHGEDGLGGFRIAPEHAADIGKVIADLRQRTRGNVWLIGTSRGTISAANAACRLAGQDAPDGVVLTSVLTRGDSAARKFWVAQSVFDLPLDGIRMPVLLVGHAEDSCIRTPPDSLAEVEKQLNGVRKQRVLVQGGPLAGKIQGGLDACAGKAAHGFLGQEQEVAEGIARFVRGAAY